MPRKNIFLFIVYGCLGVTSEIIFTGLKYNIFIPITHHQPVQYNLEGTSYIWMFFIYGSIPFIFPLLFNRISKMPIVARLFIYAICCLSIEFLAGFLLEKITGQCPWEYTVGWNIGGYIRLDYFPFWMLFGWIIERSWKWFRAMT